MSTRPALGATAMSRFSGTTGFARRPGLRADLYYFDVDAKTLPANSGSDWDGIVSPKAGIVFGPWNETEFYLNGGFGFHSNDARGVTISRDPLTGDAVDSVPPLVRTKGAEVGVRTQIVPDLTSTFALWYLHSDSELVYVGDAGNIEAGDASERYGIEWSNYWRPTSWLYVDTEFTITESRFVETGEEIENAVPVSFSGGIAVGEEAGPFASLRARYFAPRPLTGDGSSRIQGCIPTQCASRLPDRRASGRSLSRHSTCSMRRTTTSNISIPPAFRESRQAGSMMFTCTPTNPSRSDCRCPRSGRSSLGMQFTLLAVSGLNLVDLFQRGGFVMWPLLFCSVLAIAGILDRGFFFAFRQRYRLSHCPRQGEICPRRPRRSCSVLIRPEPGLTDCLPLPGES